VPTHVTRFVERAQAHAQQGLDPGGADQWHPWDQEREHRRQRKGRGYAESITLPCERTLPPGTAHSADLEAFHQQHATRGTFDPCSITRRTPH
jgi:hypothetical protein